MLRFSPPMQQKAHPVPADGSTGAGLQAATDWQKTTSDNVSKMRISHENHYDYATKAVNQASWLFRVTYKRETVM